MTMDDFVNVNGKLFLMDNTTTETHYINGKWEQCHLICSLRYPVVELSTNNSDERYLRKLFPKLKGAKRIYRKTRTDYDEDPYGRKVQRGTISDEIWDLRAFVGNNEPLGKYLDYEQTYMVHSQHPELVNIE